jgi:hypothetical protein
MTYNYILTFEYPEKVVEIKTNDIFEIMRELDKPMTTDVVTIVNGFTGEVLFRHKAGENHYGTKEFDLMCLGWTTLTEDGEEE